LSLENQKLLEISLLINCNCNCESIIEIICIYNQTQYMHLCLHYLGHHGVDFLANAGGTSAHAKCEMMWSYFKFRSEF